MKLLQRFIDWGSTSKLTQLVLTLVVYALYAAVLGASLAPAVFLVLNGIFTICYRMILPLVPMTFFSETFYRLCGMKLGRGTWINTFMIMDPYLVEIGEGTVVGGDGSTIGLRACLRKGRQVPPGSRISSLAGLDSRRIRSLEKGAGPTGRPRA